MKEEKPPISQKEMSRRGGLARAKKLNPERRRDIASFGGQVSARNKKAKKKTVKRKVNESKGD